MRRGLLVLPLVLASAAIHTEPAAQDAGSAPSRGDRGYLLTVIEGDLSDLIENAGFELQFAAKVVAVPVDVDIIPPLLARVRGIMDQPHSPAPAAGCKDCERVQELVAALET